MGRARRLVMAALLVVLASSLIGGWAPASATPRPPGAVESVPGRASVAITPHGPEATFAGGGFARGTVVSVAVDGAPSRQVHSSTHGTFAVRLPADQPHAMTASGVGPTGRPRVVFASVTRAQLARVIPADGVEGLRDVYLSLLGSLATVAAFAAALVGVRLLDRARLTR